MYRALRPLLLLFGLSLSFAGSLSAQQVVFSRRVYAPRGRTYQQLWELTWSPDGRLLLVGTYGENSSSTLSFLDYFLLDVSAHTWTRAMTGNNPIWLPDGRSIIFSTPRDLVPLTPADEHRVLSSKLARYDLAPHQQTLLTSDITNNEQPVVCAP